MKTDLTRSLEYFILGVPRSGTTIVANLFNALEDGTCLGEPHWYAQVHKKPLPYIFGDGRPGVYGFKETYRLRHPLCEQLIRVYVPMVDFYVVVFRNPVLVHSSQRALGWTEWDRPEDFVASYERLDALAQDPRAVVVVLEEFVRDPLGYLSGRLPFRIEGPLVLRPTGHEFGDPAANRSTAIRPDTRDICLTDEEIERHKGAMEIWRKWKDYDDD